MLGKLIKYEFKESWQPMAIVFGLMLAVALIDGIAMRVGARVEAFANLMSVIFGLLVVVAGVLVIVWTVKRFYDNLLSDQGYMTMALPASAAEQIGAKLIVNIVWILAYVAVVSAAQREYRPIPSLGVLLARRRVDSRESGGNHFNRLFRDGGRPAGSSAPGPAVGGHVDWHRRRRTDSVG